MPENGAKNAALLAIEILSLSDPALAAAYGSFRAQQHENVLTVDKKLKELGWKQYLEEQK
jgi:5-(carboxyamino)imidazole ribonucleotide mutase